MTERWQDYFSRENKQYHSIIEAAAAHWFYQQPLYYQIKGAIKPPARILDVGCGLGYSAIYLQQCGYQVVGVDNDETIIAKARENATYFQSDVNFEKAEARKLVKYYGQVELVYSIGVLEHFNRDETVALLQEQAKCAPLVVAVFPSKFTIYSGPITDERIYNLFQLKNIFSEAGLEVLRGFGYGDIYAPVHILVKRVLPHGIYRILQNTFSYAMSLGCIGRKKG